MFWTRWLTFVAIVSLVIMIGACARAAPTPTQAPKAAAPVATKQPAATPTPTAKYGGQFRQFTFAKLNSLDIQFQTTRHEQWILTGTVYEGLMAPKKGPGVSYNSTEMVPWLAKSFRWLDDKSIEFELRDGVKFHDGSDFDSEDVKWTLERLAQAPPTSQTVITARLIERMETPTKNRIIMRLKKPWPFLVTQLGTNAFHIMPKNESLDFRQNAIGTGPFVLDSFEANIDYRMKRNPNYWVSGLPYVDGTSVSIIEDSSVQLSAFRAGKLDAAGHANGVPRSFLEAAQKDNPKVQATEFLQNLGAGYGVNRVTRPLFNDKRVREAVDLAFDRQKLLAVFGDGYGQYNGPIPAYMPDWAWPQETILKLPGLIQPKDKAREKAKDLLAQAGVASGTKLVFTGPARSSSYRFFAPAMKDDLAKIGIEVELVGMEHAAWSARKQTLDWDIEILFGVGQVDPALLLYNNYHKDNASSSALGQPVEPALEKIIEEVLVTLDVSRKKQLLEQAQRYIVDNVLVITGVERTVYIVLQPYVRNYSDNINGANIGPRDVWLDK